MLSACQVHYILKSLKEFTFICLSLEKIIAYSYQTLSITKRAPCFLWLFLTLFELFLQEKLKNIILCLLRYNGFYQSRSRNEVVKYKATGFTVRYKGSPTDFNYDPVGLLKTNFRKEGMYNFISKLLISWKYYKLSSGLGYGLENHTSSEKTFGAIIIFVTVIFIHLPKY